MKIVLLLLVLCLRAVAEPPTTFDRLVTLDGKSYEKVKVLKVEPDRLKIEHSNGIAAVPLKLLPADLARDFAFDPQKAKAHADARANIEAAAMDAASAAIERKKAESRRLGREMEGGKLDAALEKKVNARAVLVKMSAFQDSSIGLIGRIKEGKFVRWNEKAGSMANTVPLWEFGSETSAVLSDADPQSGWSTSAYGGPSRRVYTWDGKAWYIGEITYTSILGERLTVSHYTASRARAAEKIKTLGD